MGLRGAALQNTQNQIPADSSYNPVFTQAAELKIKNTQTERVDGGRKGSVGDPEPEPQTPNPKP